MPGVPPVPISNTVVKPRAANGSRTLGPARVGRCQIYGPDVAKAGSSDPVVECGIAIAHRTKGTLGITG